MLGRTTSKKNQEVHLLQRFPSAFQRPGFIPLSCKLPGAELQQLQGRAVGHGRNAAAVAACGQGAGPGDMQALCHGDTASPLHAEMSFTALEPLPARQSSPSYKQQLVSSEQSRAQCSKQACLREGVKASTASPLCSVLGQGPSHQALTLLWDEDKAVLCGMKIKILLLKEFNRPCYQRDAIRTSWAGAQATLLPLFCAGLAMPLGCTLSLGCILVL